ncbi:ubiquinol-cytochrome C chaperone-domain-containing protein [Aspergillus floccosus]
MVARNLTTACLRVHHAHCSMVPTQVKALRAAPSTFQRHAFSSCATLPNTPSPLRPSRAVNAPNLPLQSSRSASRLSRAIMPRPGSSAETYVAYGMTQKLFEACSNQADYSIPQVSQKGAQVPKTEAGEDLGVGEGWWYQDLGLPPTFSTWSQVTFLHMYLLTVRLRALPSHESLQTYSRHLIDHFSHNAEHRMDVLHGLTSRAIRNKFLKDLFIQWRGVIAAYDEGLIKGDAVLGAAVWRNLWKASHTGPDGKELDWTKVARVVAYMRRVIHEMSQVSEADLIFELDRRSGGKPGIFGYSELDNKAVDARR